MLQRWTLGISRFITEILAGLTDSLDAERVPERGLHGKSSKHEARLAWEDPKKQEKGHWANVGVLPAAAPSKVMTSHVRVCACAPES